MIVACKKIFFSRVVSSVWSRAAGGQISEFADFVVFKTAGSQPSKQQA